uniref:F5/8 type C domain-containing protein n=1 Tax=viral metagenome TaxID=1070528 RepID=A0A6C0JKS1_9ZZZZ
MKSDRIILVTQYYVNVDTNRQKEVNVCLLKNAENIYINEIHLFVETPQKLEFIPDKVKTKIKQIPTQKKLSFETAFKYYNQNLSYTICILANSDIYLDSTIEILYDVNFDLDVILALNRYETNTKLLNGSTYNESQEFNISFIKPYRPSIWNQDAWIWKREKIIVPNSAIELGSEGCDNRMACLLKDSGLNVLNPSYLISINHVDVSNIRTSEFGITSCNNEKRANLFKTGGKNALFLENLADIPDKYTKAILNECSDYKVQTTHFEKIISEIKVNQSQIVASSHLNDRFLPHFSQFHSPSEWIPKPDDKTPYIQYNFENLYEIPVIDIKGKAVSNADLLVGHVTKFKISYVDMKCNHVWISDDTIYEGVIGENGNLIKRIYLDSAILCIKIRIHPVDFYMVSSFKVKFYHLNYDLVDIFDYCVENYKLNKYTNNDANYFDYKEMQKINIYQNLSKNHSFNVKKNILGEPILDGICLYIYVMNRNQNIKDNIGTWLKQSIDQLIIIDWSSTEEFYEFTNTLKDDRILYVRVPNETNFYRTYAQNLAGDLCKYNKICKLDSDIVLSDKFFENHPLTKGMFYVGEWLCARDENEKHTHGCTYLFTHDYLRINGYNEYIKSYGWDDSDFTNRLMLCGLRKVIFDLNMLYHVPHDDKSRISNLNTKKHPFLLGSTNRICGQNMNLWSRQNKKNRYIFKREKNNYLVAERIKEDINIFDKCLYDKSYKIALKEVFLWLSDKNNETHKKMLNNPNPDYDFIESYLFSKL